MTIPITAVTKVGPISLGKDCNFFQKQIVTNTTFGLEADGYLCDMMITFTPAGVIFNTEGSGTNTVEYSFNGYTVHGELVPATATVDGRATITFLNRKVSAIWFRVKSGSAGPITVSVEAWGD